MNQRQILTADVQPKENKNSRRFMVGTMVVCCVIKLALLLGITTIFT